MSALDEEHKCQEEDTFEEVEVEVDDDIGQHERVYGEKRKRISEKEVYAINIRDMVSITPVNRKLLKEVQDNLYRIEEVGKIEQLTRCTSTESTSSISSSRSYDSTGSRKDKKEKKIVKNKATLIKEDAQRQRDEKKVDDLRITAANTVIMINKVRDPTLKQIIQWLRTANEVPAYIAMIGGAILGKLAANDDLNLSIEIYPYWMDALNSMQAEIDACKPVGKLPKGAPKPVVTPAAKLYKEIKKENKDAWTNTMRQFEHLLQSKIQLDKRSDWVRYQLKEVEGIHPNTLYDIATYRAELSVWQLELLQRIWDLTVREDVSKDGGLLVHSTTTSGKTTLVLFSIDYFIKAGWTVVYLAPNEMLAMQCAAVIQQTSKASVSVFTENLALAQSNAQVYIIVPGYQPDEFEMSEKMMLVMDECHVMNEPYYAKYRELVEMLSPVVQAIIALSATLPDAGKFVEDLEKMFGTKFSITGTTNRPVRMRLFDGTGSPLHPWARTETTRQMGLAGPDVESALTAMSPVCGGVPDMLENTSMTRKLTLSNNIELDRIDTATIENYESSMLHLLSNDEPLSARCFPNGYESDISIKNLYTILQRISKKGNALVFCEDPSLTFQLLAKESNRQLMDTVPFWNELLTVNREFVSRICKLRTHKYLEALENLEEMTLKGVKVRDKGANDLVHSVRKEIERLLGERKTVLHALHALWKDIPTAGVILEQADFEADSISDNYQPYRHLQFGRYAFMEISSVRKLYPGMGESQCRAVTNGLALIDDFSSLPDRIAIMTAMNAQRFSIMLSGRSTLALGVNVGVYATVIYDPNDLFLPSELKQMSERSGRKGLDRTGYTTIIRNSAP